jgi:HEAT repeat protein
MRSEENLENRECPIGHLSCFFVFLLVFCVYFSFFVAPTSGQTARIPTSSSTADWQTRSRVLSEALSNGNSEEKRSALAEIRNLQTEEASRLAVPALRDKDEIVRATAAASIIFIPDNEAVADLVPLLSDKAEFVRREVAYAIGEVGNPAATAHLLKLLRSDKVLEVRTAAAMSLGKIGDASAVPELVSLLKTKPVEDLEFLRRSAARSIGQIAQIIKTGKRRVLTPQNFMPEKYKDIPPDQSVELTKQYPQFAAAVPVLANALKNADESDDTRREAAFALGAIGDHSAVAALKTQVNSSDPYLAEIVKEALQKSQN